MACVIDDLRAKRKKYRERDRRDAIISYKHKCLRKNHRKIVSPTEQCTNYQPIEWSMFTIHLACSIYLTCLLIYPEAWLLSQCKACQLPIVFSCPFGFCSSIRSGPFVSPSLPILHIWTLCIHRLINKIIIYESWISFKIRR